MRVKLGKLQKPEAARAGCEIREIQRFIEIQKRGTTGRSTWRCGLPGFTKFPAGTVGSRESNVRTCRWQTTQNRVFGALRVSENTTAQKRGNFRNLQEYRARHELAVSRSVHHVRTKCRNARGVAQQHLTLSEFDAAGRLIHTTTGIAIGDFDENHPEFDEHPDLADLLDPDSGLRNDDARQDAFYEYDSAGRQTAVVTTQVDNPNYDPQNPGGQPERIRLRSETVYDDFGRRVATREGIIQTSVFQAETIDRTYQRETNFEYGESKLGRS